LIEVELVVGVAMPVFGGKAPGGENGDIGGRTTSDNEEELDVRSGRKGHLFF